jgi:hypothetical protein
LARISLDERPSRAGEICLRRPLETEQHPSGLSMAICLSHLRRQELWRRRFTRQKATHTCREISARRRAPGDEPGRKEIRSWCDRNAVAASTALAASIGDGFGDDDAGEDRFDSVMGALGMIGVVAAAALFPVPGDQAVRHVEGWIPGMRRSAEGLEGKGAAKERTSANCQAARRPAARRWLNFRTLRLNQKFDSMVARQA